MIEVYKRKNGFTLMGHANYDEHGKDIVCAGVSAITLTAAHGCAKHSEVEHLEESGFLHVDVLQPNESTSAILEAMWIGLESLAQQYPNHINIEDHPLGE